MPNNAATRLPEQKQRKIIIFLFPKTNIQPITFNVEIYEGNRTNKNEENCFFQWGSLLHEKFPGTPWSFSVGIVHFFQLVFSTLDVKINHHGSDSQNVSGDWNIQNFPPGGLTT